jgi:hypothetical protein
MPQYPLLILANSSIQNITVDEVNLHYFMSGHFPIAFKGRTCILNFGHTETIVIVRESESFGDCCLADGPLVIRIGAFSVCLALKSFCIAAGVEILAGSCLNGCAAMSQL